MLHDIGTAVDYDDHHKHSRYLILNAGLPGFTTRETALIGQIARYHRKGSPSLGLAEALARDGDEELLVRCAALLRVAEQLERSRDQSVHAARIEVEDGRVELQPRGRRGRDARALGGRAPERPVRARVRQGAHAHGLTRGMPLRGRGTSGAVAERDGAGRLAALLEVALVVLLGRPERGRGRDLGDDAAAAAEQPAAAVLLERGLLRVARARRRLPPAPVR